MSTLFPIHGVTEVSLIEGKKPVKLGKVNFICSLNSYNISDMGTDVKTVEK